MHASDKTSFFVKLCTKLHAAFTVQCATPVYLDTNHFLVSACVQVCGGGSDKTPLCKTNIYLSKNLCVVCLLYYVSIMMKAGPSL